MLCSVSKAQSREDQVEKTRADNCIQVILLYQSATNANLGERVKPTSSE